MNISISHPTDRPNFSVVSIGDNLTVWFSYSTPIAFQGTGKIIVRQNEWGPTTGKHLSHIDSGRKENRVSGEVFKTQLKELLSSLSLTLPVIA